MIQATEGLAYLRSFPDFERGGIAASEAFGLRRILALLEEVGSPQLHLPILHLAGTKGKGSTAVMLAAILRAAGYRTGLFTQPHLVRIHERFTLNGEEIPDRELDAVMLDQIRPAIERLERRGISGVQQFEAQVALALLWFSSRGAEAVVLETGLGGRLDGTNVAPHPVATVLTPIGYDHTQVLGTTLTAIAGEKAAIIKPGSPVISARQQPEAQAVIERVAAAAASPLLLGGRDWSVRLLELSLAAGTRFTLFVQREALRGTGIAPAALGLRERDETLALEALQTPLLGEHQAENAAAAALAAIVSRTYFPRIDESAIRQGLAQARWPGRLQVLPGTPPVVLDGAHTAESARALAAALRALFPAQRLLFICGMQGDKDVEAFAGPLAPLAAMTIATQAQHPRAAAPQRIADAFRAAGCTSIESAATPQAALARAREVARTDDVIVVTGSLYVLGALLSPADPA